MGKLKPARWLILGLLTPAFANLTACATRPPASDPAALAAYKRADDPLEPLNRATFNFNMAFDKVILKPIAVTYVTIVPHPIRIMITHFLDNLSSPFILANDLLQGQPNRGAETLMRFITNTTVGLGGLFDPATKYGYPYHSADLGQTFGRWGIHGGPYIVLPFIGPSNPRDALGLAGKLFGDPTTILIKDQAGTGWSYARTGAEIIDYRAQNIKTLDDLKANSADFYAAMRSAYRQNRDYRINYGKPPVPTGNNDPFATPMNDDTK